VVYLGFFGVGTAEVDKGCSIAQHIHLYAISLEMRAKFITTKMPHNDILMELRRHENWIYTGDFCLTSTAVCGIQALTVTIQARHVYEYEPESIE